ncbi:MAG: DEAD/DEAH box helicase [Xenococcaceae cyanobacterium]
MNHIYARYPLREYQQEWIEEIWAAWNNGKRSVLAQLATAAGKTVAFAHISHDFFRQGKKVLVIAHRLELVEQAAEKLSAVIGESVGIIKHGFKLHPSRNIQVASIQTLVRRNLSEVLPDIGLLICDEAHLACASSYRQIFSFYDNAVILGATATPQRTDGQGFKDLFDHLVLGRSTETLIQQGYLSKFRLFATDQTISTVGVTKSRGDFLASDLALAVNTQVGVADVLDNWRKFANGLRTVIFASSLEHSKAIAAASRKSKVKRQKAKGGRLIGELHNFANLQ